MFENQSLLTQPILFNQTSTSNTISVNVMPHKLPLPLHDDPLYNTFLQPSQIDLIEKTKIDGYIFDATAQPTLFINTTQPITLTPVTFEPIDDDSFLDGFQPNLSETFTIKPKPSKHYYINLDRHNLNQYENLINYPATNPLPYQRLFSPCLLNSPLIHLITQSVLDTHPNLLNEPTQKNWSFSTQNPTEKNLKQIINFLNNL